MMADNWPDAPAPAVEWPDPPAEKGALRQFGEAIPSGAVTGLTEAAGFAGSMLAGPMAGPTGLGSAVTGKIAHTLQDVAKPVTDVLPKPEGTSGAYGKRFGEFLGNPFSYLGPGTIPAKVAQILTSSLGAETAAQIVSSPSLKGTWVQPIAEMIGAVIGGTAGRTALRTYGPLRPNPARDPYVANLRAEGIEPTAGDVSGSKFMQRTESTLGDALGAGGAYTRESTRVAEEFTRAAARSLDMDPAAPSGARRLTPDVINHAFDNAADAMEVAANRLGVNLFDTPRGQNSTLYNDMRQIWMDVRRERLPEVESRIIGQIQDVLEGFDPQRPFALPVAPNSMVPRPRMSGQTYQGLTRKNTPLDRMIRDPNPNISYYAARVRNALDDALTRTARGQGTQPGTGQQQALDDLLQARRVWYNALVLGKASAGPGGELITPQKLRQAITDTADKKIQYARGRGDLHDLVRAGNEVLRGIPTSQTTERTLVSRLPAAAGAVVSSMVTGEPVSGMIAGEMAPGLTGRALLSPTVQRYFKNQLLPGQMAAAGAAERFPTARQSAPRVLGPVLMDTLAGGGL